MGAGAAALSLCRLRRAGAARSLSGCTSISRVQAAAAAWASPWVASAAPSSNSASGWSGASASARRASASAAAGSSRWRRVAARRAIAPASPGSSASAWSSASRAAAQFPSPGLGPREIDEPRRLGLGQPVRRQERVPREIRPVEPEPEPRGVLVGRGAEVRAPSPGSDSARARSGAAPPSHPRRAPRAPRPRTAAPRCRRRAATSALPARGRRPDWP